MLAETEVVIVGGGPAGLATALELRYRGIDVVVVDRSQPPIDKPCGEGLMPDGVERLADLGIDVSSLDSAPLAGIRYIDSKSCAEARFRSGYGRGIRRPVLHGAMVERAEQAGVRLIWAQPVRALEEDGVSTDRGSIRADWVVGADGLHSRLRRWAGLHSRRARWRRSGIRRHYATTPWTDMVEVYWTNRGEAYVTPVSSGQVGIALLWSGPKADFDQQLERFPVLRSHLQGATRASTDRGAGQLEQRTRGVYRGNLALVGDAAGYRDAITGEGLSLAFHQAQALAAAIEKGDLRAYGRVVDKLTRMPFVLIRILLEVEARPRLRGRLIAALRSQPGLFERLLAVHTRRLPVTGLRISELLRLLSRLLLVSV